MTKKIIVTTHIKRRAHERIVAPSNCKNKKKKSYYRTAYTNGKNINDFKDEFYEYLLTKHNKKNAKIRVYDNNIFIFKNGTAITVYNVPEEYQPTSKYLKQKKIDINKAIKASIDEIRGININHVSGLELQLNWAKIKTKNTQPPNKELAESIYKHREEDWYRKFFSPELMHLLNAIYIQGISVEEYKKSQYLTDEQFNGYHNSLLKHIQAFKNRYAMKKLPFNGFYMPSFEILQKNGDTDKLYDDLLKRRITKLEKKERQRQMLLAEEKRLREEQVTISNINERVRLERLIKFIIIDL